MNEIKEEEMLTSEKWNTLYNYLILDADGWNRKKLPIFMV